MVAVPLLVTVDVEIAPDHDLDEQSEVLDRLRQDLDGFPVTWFCTAVAAEQFSEPLQRLVQAGHEIGCHGVDHSRADDYRHMTVAGANSAIAIATHRIATATGQRPRCFRGPRMTTSRHTQSALIAHGYQADFSVCAQRMDLFTCGGADMVIQNFTVLNLSRNGDHKLPPYLKAPGCEPHCGASLREIDSAAKLACQHEPGSHNEHT